MNDLQLNSVDKFVWLVEEERRGEQGFINSWPALIENRANKESCGQGQWCNQQTHCCFQDCSSVSNQTEGCPSWIFFPLGPSCSFTATKAPRQNKCKWQEDQLLLLSCPSSSSWGTICCSADESRICCLTAALLWTHTLPAPCPSFQRSHSFKE